MSDGKYRVVYIKIGTHTLITDVYHNLHVPNYVFILFIGFSSSMMNYELRQLELETNVIRSFAKVRPL